MSLIQGLHHAALKCSCRAAFEEAIHFYRDVLGLAVKRAWGEGDDAGIMFDTGCGLIEIFAKGGENHGEGSVRHFALATNDPGSCVKAVREAGYRRFLTEEQALLALRPAYRGLIHGEQDLLDLLDQAHRVHDAQVAAHPLRYPDGDPHAATPRLDTDAFRRRAVTPTEPSGE